MTDPLYVAICKRCRWPARIAKGADDDVALHACAEARCAERDDGARAWRSQCHNCCDGGHTVRLERGDDEVYVVGIRTVAEMDALLADADRIVALDLPPKWRKRVYQVWRDGEMTWHINLDEPLP